MANATAGVTAPTTKSFALLEKVVKAKPAFFANVSRTHNSTLYIPKENVKDNMEYIVGVEATNADGEIVAQTKITFNT